MKRTPVAKLAALRCAAGLASGFFVTSALALEFNFDVETGVGQSSNAGRSPEDQEVSAALGFVEVGADLEENTDRLTALLRSDLQFATYSSDQFDDETVGGVDLAVDYSIVPRIFRWVFVETFGQEATDPFRAVGTFNRENVNYVTTGPSLTAPLGPRNFMEFTALYSSVAYEENPFDNDREAGQVSLGRQIGERRTLSLVYGTQAVEYEMPSPQTTDFDTEQWFVRWESTAPRTTAQLDFGEMELQVPDSPRKDPLFRASVTRQLSSSTELTIAAGRQFADAGESFRRFQDSGLDVGASQDVVGTAEPYEDRYISLGFDRQRDVTGLSLRLGRSKETFVSGSRDRDVLTFEGSLSRQLTSLWNGVVSITRARREFLTAGQTDDELYLVLGADRALGSRMSFGVTIDSFDRDSNGADSNVNERRIFATLTYTPRATGQN